LTAIKKILIYFSPAWKVHWSSSFMAIPQGGQAGLIHSRPSLVTIKARPRNPPQQGQVLIGLSFMLSGCQD
jgi:hypothetical protein